MSNRNVLERLPGAINLKTRKLYTAIKAHYEQASCHQCKFYKQYGVMIVRGDFDDHIEKINGSKVLASQLSKLEEAKLIELDQISPNQHRVTIVNF